MFIPVGDSPNPPGTPWVTYSLIAVNILIFIALLPLGARAPSPEDADYVRYLSVIADERGLSLSQVRQLARSISAYDVFTFRHGWKPADPSLADMLWSMFLHGGLMHLLGNMLFLWIYGDNVEHRLGRAGFLAAYLGTGMLACGGDALLRLGSSVPSIGASGAISGVLGLYFIWFPRNRVRVWVFLFPLLMDIIELRARVVLGIYVVLQNLLPLLLTAGEGGVSHGAHLGGFLAGGALALVLDRSVQARPESGLRSRPASPAGPAAEDPVTALRMALAAGRWDTAAEIYFRAPHALTRRALGPMEKILLGEALAAHGHPRAALAAFQRALADHPRGPGRARAHVGAGRVLAGPLDSPTGAYQHLYAALEESPEPEEAASARKILTGLAGRLRHMPRGPRGSGRPS